VGRGGERLRAFGELPDPMQDRQQIDVGEGEVIADEKAGAGDRLVKNSQLLAHGRHDGLDRLPVRLSCGFRDDVGVDVGPDQGAVHHCIDKRDPLLGQGGEMRIGRENGRAGKAAIEIGGDGLRFKQLDVAVAQHRHLAERMNGRKLRRTRRPPLGQSILDPLLLADHAHDARVGRARRTDDLWFRHDPPLPLSAADLCRRWRRRGNT
jgi:hypothetical protein